MTDWVKGANENRRVQIEIDQLRRENNRNKLLGLKPVVRTKEKRRTKRASAGKTVKVQAQSPDTGRMKLVKKSGKDPIEFLHARGDLDDAQHKSAHRVRHLVERLGLAVRAMDPTREKVDCSMGGGREEMLTEAAQELSAIRAALGRDASNIVVKVAGYGISISEVAVEYITSPKEAVNGNVSKLTRAYVSRTLANGLTLTALHLGYLKSNDFGRDEVQEILKAVGYDRC